MTLQLKNAFRIVLERAITKVLLELDHAVAGDPFVNREFDRALKSIKQVNEYALKNVKGYETPLFIKELDIYDE